MARAVRFDLIADSSKFTRGMRDAQRSSEKFTQHTNRAGQALKAATAAFSVGVIVTQMRNWVAAARDSNKTAQQTITVLKSTHGAAGLTADQFAKLASQISKTSAVDDDLIQSGENIIATFTNIHGDVFKKTTQAAVDMTAAMNHGEVTQEGLQSSAVQLGKALNDPIKGLTALQRVGVTFSAQQKEQIADFVKHGQVAKAQGVILAEVNKEFGGSAAAAVTPAKQLAVTWGNMQEILGNLLIPAIDRGAQILSSILGVVDRNRTAFGVLFGVLGTGAAIIGTLVVAEKIHAAVTDGVKAATTAWAVVQKGLNTALGITQTQAATTAVSAGALATAEDSAAASTAAWGTATVATSRSLGASIGLIGGAITAAAAIGLVIDKVTERFGRWQGAVELAGLAVGPFGIAVTGAKKVLDFFTGGTDKHTEATHKNALETAYSAQQTEAQRQAMVASLPAFQTAADKTRLNAEAIKKKTEALKAAIAEEQQNRASMAQTIQSYDGLISKSKTTAGEVIKDLRNQTANFATYAHDAQRLIKAGVSPAAIRELSEKGPQYVHALATGSNKQLGIYKQAWADRQKEIKGSFAASIDAQYRGLVKKIKQMQAQIDSLRGKTISVAAQLKLNFSKSFTQKDWVAVRLAAGRMAGGGMLQGPGTGTSDSIPVWGSRGEFMVNADATRQYRPFLEWINAKKMATGGPIGAIDAESRAVNKLEAWGTGRRMDAGITKLMKSFGGTAAGFTGGAASGNVIRLALAQAKRMAASFKVALALIEAGIVESGLRNLNYGDRDSLGFLQQRPSQGWAHPMNISYASWDFLRRAIPIQGRYGTAGALAQAVQRSAFPGRYDMQQARALGILHAYNYDQGGVLPPGRMAINTTGRPEALGFDYDKMAEANVRAMKAAGLGAVYLDGRRVDRQQATAQVLNARRR